VGVGTVEPVNGMDGGRSVRYDFLRGRFLRYYDVLDVPPQSSEKTKGASLILAAAVMTNMMVSMYLSQIFRNTLFSTSIKQAEDRRELYKYVGRTYIAKENNKIVWLTVKLGLNFRLLGLDLGLSLGLMGECGLTNLS
jgi:hypothetical protein